MLLQALRHGLRRECVLWEETSSTQLSALFALARSHKVLPIVFEAVRRATWADAGAEVADCKKQVMLQVVRQAQMSQAALAAYEHLQSQGLHPLILKGTVCGRLYPCTDHRISGDEDFYISAEERAQCIRALEEFGLTAWDERGESWSMTGSPVHIELHSRLFSPDHILGAELEQLFEQGFSRVETYEAEPGRLVNSFDPHLHFLYLILHAFKHFLYSGFGIRQICDIGLWARQYADRIDWAQLYRECAGVRCVEFAAAVFRIAHEVLEIDFTVPAPWQSVCVDPLPLLQDVLEAGIYGSASSARVHSAVALTQPKSSPIKALFPSRSYMLERYPQWRDKAVPLPVLWAKRLGKYGWDVLRKKEDPLETVSLANQRHKLLKYYHIL